MESNNSHLLPIGATLQNGKYRIVRQLASGGFGNTYEVFDMSFDETYAMKEFYLKGVNERDGNSKIVSVSNAENTYEFNSQKEKFKKEALRLRKLSNDHVVRVYDLFEENGTAYYVMDFLKGESLSACMKKAGHPYSEEEVMDYTRQVLTALDAVHRENIWHLDLKPGNIMTDGEGRVVLIDFGASKQFHDSDGRSLSTSTGLCYTPGYAPTEQIESNTSRMGPWTDLYALGATVYNLLTMKTPPSVSDIQDGEGFDFPATVSPEMQRMVRWMMEPNRKRRPQSVEEVWRFLERYFGQPVPVSSESPVSEATVMSKAPFHDASSETPVYGQQQPEYYYEDEESSKRPWLIWLLLGVGGVAAAAIIVAAILIVPKFFSKKDPLVAQAPKEIIKDSPAPTEPEDAAPMLYEEPEILEAEPEVVEEKPEAKQEKRQVEEVQMPVRDDPEEEPVAVVRDEKPAQTQTENDNVFDVVEQMPRFPGDNGDGAALVSWIGRNLRYPPIAEENGIKGRVICQFVVERDGSITDVSVVKSVDPSLDKEAVRVIKAMPKWSPGMQKGEAVRVKYTLPITFNLR